MPRLYLALVTLAGYLIIYPTALVGQPSPGCPWCTTPTKCEAIKESTPIAGCYILEGVGTCEEMEGECEYEPTFAYTQEVLDVTTADLLSVQDPEWGAVFAFPIESGLYGWWNCEGKLVAIYAEQEDGSATRLPVEEYAEKYTFRKIASKQSN